MSKKLSDVCLLNEALVVGVSVSPKEGFVWEGETHIDSPNFNITAQMAAW